MFDTLFAKRELNKLFQYAKDRIIKYLEKNLRTNYQAILFYNKFMIYLMGWEQIY